MTTRNYATEESNIYSRFLTFEHFFLAKKNEILFSVSLSGI